MTAKQEIIAAAWKANPTETSVRIVEIIKAGGTEVSKSAVDNMKKELGMVATGQRGRKKANSSATAVAKTGSPSTERSAIVFAAPSESTEGNAAATATVSVTPVAPVIPVAPTKSRKSKVKAKKATKPQFVPTQSAIPPLATPEPFDGVVRQYADRCVAYLTQAKSGAAGNKACVADLKRAFGVLGISLS